MRAGLLSGADPAERRSLLPEDLPQPDRPGAELCSERDAS